MVFNRKLLFIILSIFVLSSISTLTHKQNQSYTEKKILMDTLSQFIVPEIIVNDNIYHVKDGNIVRDNDPSSKLSAVLENKILRLAYYSILQRRNPILGLEGMDSESLARTLSLLRESTKQFSHYYTDDDRAIIDDYFYPFLFLETLPELEKLRKEVVETPTESNILDHTKHLQNALLTYQDYVEKLEEIYTNLNTRFGSREVQNVGGFTSNKHLLTFASELRVETASTLEEHNTRMRCLEEFSSICTDLHETGASLLSQNKPLDSLGARIIPTKILTNKYIHENVWGNRENFVRPQNTPTVELYDSDCFNDTPESYYYLWWEKLTDDTWGLNTEYLNNIYFYDVEKRLASSTSQYLEMVKSAGISYLSQALSNLYMCPNQGKDSALIGTMYKIYSLLRNNSLFAEKPPNDSKIDFSTITELERSIISSDILYQHDVETYVNELIDLLHQNGEIALLEILDTEQIFYIEEMIGMHVQKSAAFDSIVAEIVATNNGLTDILDTGVEIPFDYFLMSRSYPVLTLLTFNPTLAKKSPSFLSRSNTNTFSERLAPYWGELNKTMTPEDVITNMSDRNKLLREEKLNHSR